MKKLFTMMLAALSLCACEKKEDNGPKVSFESASYTLLADSIEVKLVVSNYTGPEAEIPIVISGDAVEGTDYTVSAKKFVIGGSTQSLSIVVYAKDNYSNNKIMNIALGALPSSVAPGKNATSMVAIGVKESTIYSFTTRNVDLISDYEVELALFKADGTPYIAEAEMKIPLVVDAESPLTTAVQGTHYDFDGKAEVVIKVGKSSGVAKLKWLMNEKDKDVVIIKANPAINFAAGQNGYMKFTIKSFLEIINGTWVFSNMPTNQIYFDESWGEGTLTYDEFPVPAMNESIIVNKDEKTIVTNFTSTLNNYFAASSTMTWSKVMKLNIDISTKPNIKLYELNNINRYFCSSSVSVPSQDNKAFVGFDYVKDDNNEPVLKVYLIDYEPKAFMKELVDFGMIDAVKPTAIMSSTYLILDFKRQK